MYVDVVNVGFGDFYIKIKMLSHVINLIWGYLKVLQCISPDRSIVRVSVTIYGYTINFDPSLLSGEGDLIDLLQINIK